MSETLILIPSRLSATRLKRKPLLKINNLSLINHVYQNAIKSKIGDVYVVTGDKKIYLDVKRNGGKCVLTKQKHRSGTDRIFEGLKILKKNKIKYVLNIQGDEPLLNISDIQNLNYQIVRKKQSIGTLVCKIENKLDFQNKNIVKVISEKKLNYNLSSRALKFYRTNKKKIKNTYHHIGCYIYKVSILKKIASLKQTNNEKKLKLEQYRWIDNLIPISLVLAKKKPIGVDTAKDFKLVKKIMENKF